MKLQFVAKNPDGEESEWTDPVRSITVRSKHLVVNNGYFEYFVNHQEGWSYELREVGDGKQR